MNTFPIKVSFLHQINNNNNNNNNNFSYAQGALQSCKTTVKMNKNKNSSNLSHDSPNDYSSASENSFSGSEDEDDQV